MPFRLLFITFLLLLSLNPTTSPSSEAARRIPIISNVPLINAYLTGNKTGLSKNLKNAHRDLNLQHLMTPSGLHLTSLLLLVSIFLRRRLFQFFFLFALSFIIFPYDGVDSFKRMVLFGILRKNPLRPLSLKYSYLLTFFIAFCFGHYFKNPISFCLSFIFIGALICSKNKLQTFITLAFLQIILANWFDGKFSLQGIFWGLSLSMISPLLFPLLIVETFFQGLPFSSLWIKLLLNLHKLSQAQLEWNLLFLTPFVFYIGRPRIRAQALAMSLIFMTMPLGHNNRGGTFPSPPPLNYVLKKPIKDGTQFIYENGMKCFSRLKGDQWSHHCYK